MRRYALASSDRIMTSPDRESTTHMDETTLSGMPLGRQRHEQTLEPGPASGTNQAFVISVQDAQIAPQSTCLRITLTTGA